MLVKRHKTFKIKERSIDTLNENLLGRKKRFVVEKIVRSVKIPQENCSTIDSFKFFLCVRAYVVAATATATTPPPTTTPATTPATTATTPSLAGNFFSPKFVFWLWL